METASNRYRVVLRNIAMPNKQKSAAVVAPTENMAYSIANSKFSGWEAIGASSMGVATSAFSLTLFDKKGQARFPDKELIRFCRGLAIMLNAGISTVDSLNFYATSMPQKDLADVIRKIAHEIEIGEAPDVAFAKTGRFNNTFTGLIKAGVTSGNIPGALQSVAHQMSIMATFRTKLKRIITVPIAVLSFLVLLFIAAQNIITPRIELMLKGNRVAPDAFSAIIFSMSHFVQAMWIPFLLIVAAVALAIWFRESFRSVIINLLMSKWAVLRNVIMSMRQLTFVGTLSMLQTNKIVMDESLRICVLVLKGSPMEPEIQQVRNQYLSGIPLSDCIKRYSSCESSVVHMVAIGEKTANLPEQLARCTTMLESQAEESMDDFATVTGFISTVVPVFVIGFTFVSSYLPIILMSARLMQGFSGK